MALLCCAGQVEEEKRGGEVGVTLRFHVLRINKNPAARRRGERAKRALGGLTHFFVMIRVPFFNSVTLNLAICLRA